MSPPHAAESADIAERFDLRALPEGFHADPYPVYRALREHAPVKRLPDGGVLLTRHADCEFVYKRPALFASDKREEFRPKYGESLLYEHHTTSLVFNDPPRHTRVRRLISGALTPRAIATMQPGLERLVETLLDRMAGRHAVDLVADFAAAIPVEVIGNLLAVPAAEREPLRDWSLAILGALEPLVSADDLARGNRAVGEFIAYLDGLVAARRAEPLDPEQDVLTRLLQGDGAGERLAPAELLHNCIFLLNAGHETTTNVIANGLVAFASHPEQRERLLADPSLARTAVEEVLRFESPNQLGNRRTTEATDVGGVRLEAGTSITLCIGAANRDPLVFDRADRFDVGRTPNRHLAFGSGIHVCAGNTLARLEATLALGRFIDRFPRFALDGEPRRGGRARFRGFLRIPCRLDS